MARSGRRRVGTSLAAVALLAAGPVDDVCILQGTDADPRCSRGSALPLVGEPWGMTDWSVQTTGSVTGSRFFDPVTKTFAGFRGTRQPSP